MQTVVVAVGVLIDAEGRVLVSRRAPGADQGGLWEFPGGKVMVVEHDYGDKQVRLDVHRVTRWQGEPRGREGQPLAWQFPTDLSRWPFPAANTSILARLCEG